jgi:L-arabinose transport system ATP-binding protein
VLDGTAEAGLVLAGLSKGFAGVQALSDVSLTVHRGEILALVGENGAGKSTLLRILSGDHVPDAGTIRLGGRTVSFASPLDARRSGIRVIYQEPEIIGGVDVAENIYVGELPRRGPLVWRRRLRELVQADLERYGFRDVLPVQLMGEQLSAAQRQLVEIMRALKSDVRVLALDEPTSSLTDTEVERLFALVRQLRAQGVAIIYVSHRIKEILQLADRVAVLRDGRLVATRPVAELSEDEIVRLMVGRQLEDVFHRRRAARADVVLRVEELHSPWHRAVSLEVRAGEVVGLAGLVGAGRTELAKVIFGELPLTSGRVLVGGRAVTIRRPGDAIRLGLGFAPEDRRREALIMVRSVMENVSLAILRLLTRFHLVRPARERRIARELVDRLRVRTPSLEQEVRKLSGGNMQKVVLARWLARRPKLLILDEPTRGIDVGAKAEIYRLIDELANEGIAILLISSELPEILGLSDRILVMQGGTLTGELPGAAATEEQVLSLAMAAHLSAAGGPGGVAA